MPQLTDRILALCSSPDTLTSALSADPSASPHHIARKLYPRRNPVSKIVKKIGLKKELVKGEEEPTEEEIEIAFKCGKWGGKRPSELFLKIYRDVLLCLELDPMAGMVSPPLLGSSGTIPLSIVSVIPDIMSHYALLLSLAHSSVLLATNFWQNSKSSHLISDALRTLSKRAHERGQKVVVKLMYDRGTPEQVVQNHTPVKPEDWTKDEVQLPSQEELPGIDMEVVNYHHPLLGTFHSKYMIVDKKVAVLSSNNIQDRPNVEMMIHLEGPIVDSFYDMALLSWNNALHPPLPELSPSHPSHPSNTSPTNNNAETQKPKFGEENEYVGKHDHERAKGEAREELRQQEGRGEMREGGGGEGVQGVNAEVEEGEKADGTTQEYGSATTDSQNRTEVDNLNKALHDGDGGKETAAGVAHHLDIDTQLDPTAKDIDGGDFQPHIVHAPHEPFPIAMVCRAPYGDPGHEDYRVPQDAAWLAAFRYAKKDVFVQTPTFNASPVIPATLDACRRGVQVTLYLDLGFNDSGEMIPGQGGTNEQVVSGMYKTLHAEQKGAEKNLKVYWYTSKDQVRPMNAKAKQRNCHVKFMSVDGQVAIVGNGNQDTQSWFHSQEINVLVDSPAVIAEWRSGLDANQNTRKYGLVDEDGIWRYREDGEGHSEGDKLETLGQTDGGVGGRVKGLLGAVARVRGKGGF